MPVFAKVLQQHSTPALGRFAIAVHQTQPLMLDAFLFIRRFALKLHNNKDCKPVQDMHEVFQREDIDAVLIATGDRWHATASMIAASSHS